MRLVVDRSVRRLCIALNRFAEASATTEIRLSICRRLQESKALREKPITTQKEVAKITVCSSAETVKRLSMEFPQANSLHLDRKG